MVDYLQNYNMDNNVSNYFFMQPGDSYEAPIYTAKEAYQAAISTMQNNHPNDWVTLVPYSWPRSSATDTHRPLQLRGAARWERTTTTRPAALLFPFSTINADGSSNQTEVTPYDPDPATGLVPSANFTDTPRADGDTCFAMALMLCLQPVRRHPLHRYAPCEHSSPRRRSRSPPAWPGAWDARGPRRSSSSRPTDCPTAWRPPTW